jgi:hypothetical protein
LNFQLSYLTLLGAEIVGADHHTWLHIVFNLKSLITHFVAVAFESGFILLILISELRLPSCYILKLLEVRNSV